jgi:hypothetical protein
MSPELADSVEKVAADKLLEKGYATIESGRMDFGINVAHPRLILNQSYVLG